MLLQLQAYNTELTHIPGMDIPIANNLSRKFLPDTYLQLTEGMDLHVHTVISSLRMSGRRMEEARSATQADPQMKVLMNVIQYALPECRKKNVSHVLEFWNQGDELSKIDGNIFKGCKINIPRDVLYIRHLGGNKCWRGQGTLYLAQNVWRQNQDGSELWSLHREKERKLKGATDQSW